MKRGVAKHSLYKKLVLERKTLTVSHILTLDQERCFGCGICALTCPEEAVEVSSAIIRDGKLVRRPMVDFTDKCTFCGECVALCPINAIRIQVNGVERIPVVEDEAFPNVVKEIALNAKQCWWGAIETPCNLDCEKACPMEAINVTVERVGRQEVGRIVNVEIDGQNCIFCKRCEAACPEGAIHVIKPFHGFIQMDTDLCPEGCQACADICPSKAISFTDYGKPVVDEEFCIFCGACEEVCPKKAININRTRIFHTDIKSGAWIIALEKLASHRSVFNEMNSKSNGKRKEIIKNAFKMLV
jgi:4Fe-4S ferredoxin